MTDAPSPSPSPASRLGSAVGRAAGSALIGGRAAIRRSPTANRVYRTGVGIVGGGTVALGVVLIPLPGPGALVALGGLGILGTEFEKAQVVNEKATRVVKRGLGAAKDAVARRRAAKVSPEV
ncbi:PGPGW domain-containing protein [Pseudolysinimonas sp.]|uniref:PGPGW domain-containing protein n=1 Tax=Pseudolysinimonas sp. TaxID=2680009 RepID=UPI0037831071